jgi:hypothetical protein
MTDDKPRGAPRGTPEWVPDPELAQPGTDSDARVGAAQSVHAETVRRWRARRGIAPWRRGSASDRA